MSDLKAHPLSDEEVDGLDEAAAGVPAPNTASAFAAEYALPTVVPRHVHPLAVVSVLLAVLMPIVAIPLAHWVMRRLQHHGGRGLAVVRTAIIVGYLNILLLALIGVNVLVAALISPS